MRYGHFDDARREYVVTRPDTPLPWINFLGCEDFFGVISNTGGGYSFYKDARLRRLTRYRHNNAPLDVGSRYIYLRDDGSSPAGALYWSPSWMPTRRRLDTYECRHGLGYTSIRSQFAGIEAQTRYFIPLGETLEVWELTLTNHRTDEAELSVFAGVEFCLWDALDDATNFQRNYSIGEVEIPTAGNGAITQDRVIIHKSEYRERRDHFAYFACSEQLTGFDTDREAFLGPYRGWDSPLAVERGQAFDSEAHGWQPIAIQHVKVRLQPDSQKTVIFLLGYHQNPAGAKFDPPGSQTVNRQGLQLILARYLDPLNVIRAFDALQSYWDGLLGRFTVETPDLHTNRMVNIWNTYQVMTTFNLSRSASYFESGIGRGIGFRDSNQDLLGFVHLVPERARQRILDLAGTQLPNGGAYHQYQPLTKRGNNDIGSNFNDDPLWLVLSVAAYVKETGDSDILKEPVPFDNLPGSEAPLREHLRRSIRYTLDRLGPHGLPLIGRADWNDCLNLNCFSDQPGQSFQTTTNKDGAVAESVFIAGLFILAAKEMAELAKGFPDSSGDDYLGWAGQMEAALWSSGWDGDWFRRAYDDFGHVLGSAENSEGRIFVEPQGICVMAGLGLDDGRALQALNAVRELLGTPHGILLHQPAFTRYYLHLGEISSYPPGYKENGSVFCHANPWIMIAETMIGRGDEAHDYYLRINPSRREDLSEVHRCEPYVYAQMIAGRDAPNPGEAKNSWLTGAAAWNLVAITQWILGIRPTYQGLKIAPVIPAAWSGFAARRRYRNCTFEITVRNPEHVCRGVRRMLLDGREVAGDLIPDDLPAGEHQIEVWLGDYHRREPASNP